MSRKKLTYEYIKKQTPTIAPGHQLLSIKYKNSKTKLKFKCDKEHIYKVTWSNFKTGIRCPRCNKYCGLTIEYVRKQTPILVPKYKLLSTEYINNRTKLKFKCDKSHEFEMSWASFSQGNRCPECYRLSMCLSLKFIKEQIPILANGYSLLSTKYINSKTKLKFKCDKNHIFWMKWCNFQKGSRCPECNKLLRYLAIKEQISVLAPGYELLSDKYINNSTKLKFKCDKGHIFKMTWGSFQHGTRCPKCYYKSLIKDYTPKELNELDKYKRYITQLSNRNYKKYKKIVNPNNLERGRNKYHLDHVFSIMEGFRRNIPPKYIANPYNLQMLCERKNIIKKDRNWQSEKMLYIGYAKFKNELKDQD